LAWQIEQKVRAKNTGLDRKLSRSAFMPVEIACPDPGHLIMITPILFLLVFFVPTASCFATGWNALFSSGALVPADPGGLRRFD
jgi:hypothetical protein